jgi:hypothetical protein
VVARRRDGSCGLPTRSDFRCDQVTSEWSTNSSITEASGSIRTAPLANRGFSGALPIWLSRMFEMPTPLLKDQCFLTEIDFRRYPVWVRVQDYDRDEYWFQDSTEQTYRPWDGLLPLEPDSQFPFVLLAASFRLSSGECYPGYFQPATEEWDTPLQPRNTKDGTFAKPLQWSVRHGGTLLSILALHSPVVFIGDKAYDFHLRRDPETRKKSVLDFYTAVGKRPDEVFPVEFSAAPALFRGIVSGRLDGFYTFPPNRPFEIDNGERYLAEAE